MEDINRHPEETSTIGRGSLSHHATPAYLDGRNSLHYTHGWSHVTRPYPTYAPGPSSSHYTSSSPPGHPYPYQHGTPSPPVHALPAQHGFIPSSSHHSTPSPPVDVYPHDHGVLHLGLANVLCNIYLIAKKRKTSIYLTEEVLEHYKRMRATNEAFKKKSEQISSNRKSEVGEPSTGISLHNAGSISARQHGDTLEKKLQCHPTRKETFRHLHAHSHDGQSFVDQRSAKIDAELTRRLEEMSTQTPDTLIDEDAVYLEVVPEVKGRVYELGSQGYHRSISLGGASSSRGPAYGLHELEELQRDHQRL
ncbi:hypothetical protein Syun_011989 [Stephania yunnanensis]|uniref:Uncharacterized protein n=1 Tax=Stephania yunnanensis TaxID=152371 RepID=A0AAP0JZC7_9MAGN